ncbi:sensor histidine kinase [Pedobacter faecalis]|uniref:sensor histidine kinase n=1 Tax=Pedobacter faecalis TaxID=3041495 RepID=UPI00254D06BA|nr:HAMP domain-containing sensor histidine kinase [Pedobacter sp. ELA7]
MSIAGNIRFLLLILGACCIVTAISLKHSISKEELLKYEASKLQNSLKEKEEIIHNFLLSARQVESAKRYHLNEAYALNFINNYRDQGINILTYKDGRLRFWSSFKAIPPNPEFIREGSSFVQLSNGWYELIKKTSGAYDIIFLIEIRTNYPVQNEYLSNQISPLLSETNALELAVFTDKQVYGVHNLEGKLFFEVKLKPNYSKSIYSTIELWLWIIGIFSFCLFVNSFCGWLVKKGYPVGGTLLLMCFFMAVRISDLEYGWFNRQFDLLIFSPNVYAESFFMPSLGDFLLNVIAITWIVLFMYTHTEKYRTPDWLQNNRSVGLIIHGFFLIAFAALAYLFDQVFFGLIINSKINFDITNIINLGWITWVSIVILCLVWFNTYLVAQIFMQQTLQLKVSNRDRLVLFLTLFLVYLLYRMFSEFSVFFIAYALFIFIMGWNFYQRGAKFSIGIFAALFFCLAFISSVKYLKFTEEKERTSRITIAQRLEDAEDFKTISAISSLEKAVLGNSFVLHYFKQPALSSGAELRKHINRQYLETYLPKFEFDIYAYNHAGLPMNGDRVTKLGYFKNMVQSGSVKLQESDFFYKINNAFGYQHYFGIIPVIEDERFLGTLVVELKTQPYNFRGQVPEILLDRSSGSDDDYANYSIAFYKDGKLESQSGKYTYKLTNYNLIDNQPGIEFTADSANYSHLIYSPGASKVVVISRENVSYITRLATLSFFLLVFILFSITLYILIWLLKNIDESWTGWFNINRSLMINANKILYKTRIQFSIILSVVATLLIVGWTTYFYMRKVYRIQQEDVIKEKVRKVQESYERQIVSTGIPYPSDKAVNDFNQFADINASYLNLFDTDGQLIFTSLPRMFDLGIINRRMGSRAFIHLSQLQRSEYINPAEKVGMFTYASGYAPIRDGQNRTVAYINVPYYANEADYQNKIGVFINLLINIYALVFVGIGILAVFLANQITAPLTFIQESIKQTKLGQRNQPIVWHRHDEIGSLIKEYNKMIAALEESAAKLARSERESAWREMAKQVAHEIKNPLTPLKLGVQLLEKSWRENDPNFEQKFERFNKSFIEQIDSLSTIASEFSNFAKMPDTKLERLSLLPVIGQARDVFTNTSNVEILIRNHAGRDVVVIGDKGQLLRSFNNLFKNAIEAARPNEACRIQVLVKSDQQNVYIEVDDNGKGIDTGLQDKIFVPNFTTKSSGTGLGLAFVKQAIENAGGSIAFKSFDGVGTTFYLTFPLS